MQMHSECLHLIPSVTHESYGIYDCVSRERDYTKFVKKYQLMKPMTPIEEKGTKILESDASAPVPQTMLIILQTVALRGIFR